MASLEALSEEARDDGGGGGGQDRIGCRQSVEIVSAVFSWTKPAPSSASASEEEIRTRFAAAFASSIRPCSLSSARPRATIAHAGSIASAAASKSATSQPTRANTIDQERPIKPAPITATRGIIASPLIRLSQPQHFAAQCEIVTQL